MRNLKQRLEKLEEVYNPPKAMVVILDWYTGGKALGVKLWDMDRYCACGDFYVRPLEGESDESLCARSEDLARAYVLAHPAVRQDCISLRMERDWGPYSDPKHEPEPEPMRGPTVKPKVEVRQATIKEVEGAVRGPQALGAFRRDA